MTRLYIADVNGIDIDFALSRVSEYRRDKANRIKPEAEKRRSLGAELLLRRAFGEDFEYGIAQGGKPIAEGAHFSLSHSGDFAVCAVGDAAIGVDIDYPRKNPLPLARRFFSEEEYAEIEESDHPDETFCALWVLKEACIKCSGDGIRGLSETRISDYFTCHITHEGYHIGIASESDLGEIEIHIEEI